MRIYTILTSRNQDLHGFATLAKSLKATGVTIITSPQLVAPPPVPDDQSEQRFLALADAAAAKKDYVNAAKHQESARQAKAQLAALALQGADWIKQAITPIMDITQLVVVGTAHWPQTDQFTLRNVFRHLGPISDALLTNGIGGIVQKTPLDQRTFIPLEEKTIVVAAGNAASGEPAEGLHAGPVETPGRHPSIPAALTDAQATYAARRLGLDRGGKPRSANETANMSGLSLYNGKKLEAEVMKAWPEFEAKIVAATPAPAAA